MSRSDQNQVIGELISSVRIVFCTPRRLPSAQRLEGRVVILDLAFAASKPAPPYPSITHKLIEQLGPRLACYLDHHDSIFHHDFRADPRFILATKAEHGACPEMVTEERVQQAGEIQTILCHDDFDGIASAAKWLCGGREPYEGCDADSYAIDTRLGTPSAQAARMDRALRGDPKSYALRWDMIRLMIGGLQDQELWHRIDQAGAQTLILEREAEALAEGYRLLSERVIFVDATFHEHPFDRTHLLLKGQQRALISVLRIGDNVTFAAPFTSGINFLHLFALSGGMPTVVSLPSKKLKSALLKLQVPSAKVHQLLDDLEISS